MESARSGRKADKVKARTHVLCFRNCGNVIEKPCDVSGFSRARHSAGLA